jgi:hypothetical protein
MHSWLIPYVTHFVDFSFTALNGQGHWASYVTTHWLLQCSGTHLLQFRLPLWPGQPRLPSPQAGSLGRAWGMLIKTYNWWLQAVVAQSPWHKQTICKDTIMIIWLRCPSQEPLGIITVIMHSSILGHWHRQTRMYFCMHGAIGAGWEQDYILNFKFKVKLNYSGWVIQGNFRLWRTLDSYSGCAELLIVTLSVL